MALQWTADFIATSEHFGEYSLAALPGGGVIAVWLSGTGIEVGRFSSSGAALGGTIAVNSDMPGYESRPKLAVLADGRFMVTWTETVFPGGDTNIKARAFKADGTPDGPEFIASVSSTGMQDGAAVTVVGNQYMLSWTDVTSDRSHLTLRFFDGNGLPTSGEVRVSPAAAGIYQTNQEFTLLPSGNVVVTWKEAGAGYVTSTISPAGAVVSPRAVIGAAVAEDLTILQDGRIAAVWTSGYTVELSIHNADGSVSLSPTTLFDGDPVPAISFTLEPRSVSALTLPDGRIFVSWMSVESTEPSKHMQALVVDEYGVVSGPLVFDTVGSVDAYVPSVTLTSDGKVAVAYSGGSYPGTSALVRIMDPLRFEGQGGDDTWLGGKLAETMNGYGGIDIFRGKAGNDTLDGGTGNDWLYGDGGTDKLVGGDGTDNLYGGTENDELRGGAGGDYLNGGNGNDTASYYSDGPVNTSLDGSIARSGAAVGDFYSGIENLAGSNVYNDKLAGDGAVNILYGNGGNDLLYGRGGADVLVGGFGRDTFAFDSQVETGDRITDFDTSDYIQLEGSAFGLGTYAGALASANFISRTAGHVPGDANDYFVFDQYNDTLWYDRDATGVAVAIMIADLNNVSFGAGNILVV